MGAFAQSPQAIVLEDKIRVFFTTRRKVSGSEFWTSYPMYVDFSRDMGRIQSAPRPVGIEPSSIGNFDEHGIFPFSPTIIGAQVFAYTTGWSRRKSVSVETGIGLMVSDDFGQNFTRVGNGPVLSANLYEPFLVCDGFVLEIDDDFLMWYCFGTDWRSDPATGIAERTYKITQTRSGNPYQWKNSGGRRVIPEVRGELEAQALPSVATVNDSLWMVFCHRETFGFRAGGAGQYSLGFAESKDGESWARRDSFVEFQDTGFDSEMRCYPNLFVVDDTAFLLYNGNDFGQSGFGMAKCSI